MAFINLSHFGVEEKVMRIELTFLDWQTRALAIVLYLHSCTCKTSTLDRLLRPITSSKVLHLGVLIETAYLLDSHITLTQDEAFL